MTFFIKNVNPLKKINCHKFLYSIVMMLLISSVSNVARCATQEQIDNTVKRINAVQFVQGQFNQQKKLQGLAYPLKSQGHFIFWKDRGLYLAIDKPFFNAMTITSNAMINWQTDGTGSIAQEQSGIIQNEINKTLLAFFSADMEMIQQRFATAWAFDRENWQLTLTPKLDIIKKNIRSAIIHGNTNLQGLSIMAGNGDETTIEFTEQKQSAVPSKEACRWFYLQPQEPCSAFK